MDYRRTTTPARALPFGSPPAAAPGYAYPRRGGQALLAREEGNGDGEGDDARGAARLSRPSRRHEGTPLAPRHAGTLLLAHGDAREADLLRYALEREGFAVESAATGREVLGRARGRDIDLLILDAALPDLDGLRVLAALRHFSRLPVIMLTATLPDEAVLAGFNAGADDHVARPFNVRILVARVQAVLRRAMSRGLDATPGAAGAGAGQRVYEIDGATFNGETNVLSGRDLRLHLTPSEGRILRLLASHRGRALSSETISERAGWGDEGAGGTGVVRTHVYHLRDKLARISGKTDLIRTVPGAGYTLAVVGGRDEGDGDDAE